MSSTSLIWLFGTLFCIFFQGFFSMVEMAAVSINRVRLEYYLSKGSKRAEWLSYLLKSPARLFGTVMLGVNIALQVGSQSSREFYLSLGIDPNLAPITQVVLVVIIAELSPLFAARKHSEQVAMWGVPYLYFTYKIFAPVIWFISIVTRFAIHLFGGKSPQLDALVTRDELQKILELHDETGREGEEFQIVVRNLFKIQNKGVTQVMTSLQNVVCMPANSYIWRLRKKFEQVEQSFIPLFHKKRENIVAIAFPKDLVRLGDNHTAREHSKPPWFVTVKTPLMQIFQQFKKNKQSVAVVLNEKGQGIGVLTLEAILTQIFGEQDSFLAQVAPHEYPLIERLFPGNMKVHDFNREFNVHLEADQEETLAQFFLKKTGHLPEKGETIITDRLEFTAEEVTLTGIKSITIKTQSK